MSCKKSQKLYCMPMTARIKIQTKVLGTDDFDVDPDYEETFTELTEVSASCETLKGYSSFNNVGTRGGNNLVDISHKFNIRFNPNFNITTKNFIEYKNERYVIMFVENLDEADNWVILHCRKRGDKTKEANFA